MWLNSVQKQILLYLYDLRETPTKAVAPDPRLTLQSIARILAISPREAYRNLGKLIDKAYVRGINLEFNTYFCLTSNGQKEVEKRHVKWFRLRLGTENTFVEGGIHESRE